jgi:Tfp pilus assembly protein PilF
MTKTAFQTAMVVLSIAAGSAFGADTTPSSTPARRADPALERYEQAVGRQDWTGAQAAMKDALSREPGNADFNNLYAYSLRKGPNPDMNLVFKFYNEALRIDPKHKGAHEYLGEAYLMVGNVEKAKEHLAALDKICFFSCAEFAELKKSIADYEAKTAKR